MAESLSRELILPARRLAVPEKPSDRQLAAAAAQSPDVWSATPREWVTQQVVRLAVAAVLRSQVERSGGEQGEQATLGQVATLFRPHAGLAAQAFRLGVVEAVNAGVPAAVDPLRDALRRLGVTGREPLVMVALGLDRVPAGAGDEFWTAVRTSTTVTAVIDAITSGHHGAVDLGKLDRRQLARADALVLAGGRVTPVSLVTPPAGKGGGWLQVPVALTKPRRRSADELARGGKGGPVEVVLRADGWTEVFETALDAVSAAMHQLDGGSRPQGRGRTSSATESLVQRLVSARKRPVGEVITSLRAVDEFVLEMFDHQVTMTDVRVAVPVLEDDALTQLWLSPEALAGPLVTGAADLFLGGRAETRPERGGREGGGRDGGGRGRPEGGRGRGEGRGDGRGEGGRGGRRGRGPRGEKPAAPESGETAGASGPVEPAGAATESAPVTERSTPTAPEPTSQPAPEPTPPSTPEPAPAVEQPPAAPPQPSAAPDPVAPTEPTS
ncbi:hypothetical protein [Nocardioides rubriscoriae]|uniref:hypothetical protein n=1 Tax=Nocardioides rubriscoriae TaxID=642762 RepID=UPI0011DF82C4|nr:hypothetical protein [Nocardioides rubriscoriae]